MKTIFHFLLPGKISIDIIENFEQIGNNNYYFFFDETDSLKNSLPSTKNGIQYLNFNDSNINALVSSLKPNLILLYSLNFKFAKVINEVQNPIKIGWFAWGYDIYSLPRIRLKLYGENTLKYILSKKAFFVFKNRLIEKLFDFAPDFILKHLNLELFREVLLAHKKVDYFISYIKEDFSVFSEYYPNKMEFVYAPFLNLEQYLGKIENPYVSENERNILVGNSASLECNYFEVLEILKQNIGRFNKAYFILNYGGQNTIFRDDFKLVVDRELRNQGEAIIKLMDLETYVSFLKSCNTAVFLHYRQQAMGNILTLLYLGARVYLSRNNPILSFFKRYNIKVFLFEEDFDTYGVSDLSFEDKTENKKSIESIFITNGDNIYSNILNIRV